MVTGVLGVAGEYAAGHVMGGQMRRYRTCDNPRPSSGGRACGGPDSQIQRCNTDMCPGELPNPWQENK